MCFILIVQENSSFVTAMIECVVSSFFFSKIKRMAKLALRIHQAAVVNLHSVLVEVVMMVNFK